MGADVRGGRLQWNARRWMAAAPGGCLVGLLIAALAALLAVQYNLEDLRHRNLSVLTRGHPPGRSQTHQCRAPCTRSQARKSRWTLRAPASRWCWRATTWNKPKPSSPASTGTCSWSCSPRTRHVDWQERWPGIRGTPPAWTGKPSLMWCPGSSVARGWYNGKTGASVTHVAGARRELRESEAARLLFSGRTLIRLTSFTSPNPHRPLPVDRSRLYAGRARAPWRPRLMRASAFQRPQHLVLVPRRRVARWILNLPALPQHKAWQRHRAQPSGAEMRAAPPPGGTTGLSRILLVHPHLTAHNLVPPYCYPTEKITRNTSSFPKSVGRSGPNAGGGRLQQVLMWIFLPTTAGVRVSSMAEVEEGPGLCTQFSGKPIGTAPAGGNTRTPHKSAKRSYNRACRRANQSIQAGTWYRGRWHTRAALDSLRIGPNRPQSTTNRSERCQPRRRYRPENHIRVLCWNSGGLSSHILQEFLAWCDTRETALAYDAIVITESHWREVQDYRSGQWLCVHSSGYSGAPEPDRFAGILCLLSARAFAEPRVLEHIPGRLLQVGATHLKSNRPMCLIGLYQHVWRPHLGAAANRALRSATWHKLQQIVTATPARHQLIIAGDLNATLKPRHPFIGTAVPSSATHSNHDKELQTLVQECGLCAVNTWHASPVHTYYSPTVSSQIDYVLVRQSAANHRAKLASPISGFPVGANRQTNHLPVQAAIPMLPMSVQARTGQKAVEHRFQATALQAAVARKSPDVQALQAAVAHRLAALPEASPLCEEHDRVNTILLEEVSKAFPAIRTPDSRVSANPGFRASARTTWHLHTQLRRSGLPSLSNIWSRWRLYTAFMKASAALRRQSKELKRAFQLEQLQQAEEAACKGDHRGLFLVARRLAPRQARGVSRLLGDDGKLLSGEAELAAMLKHSRAAFANTPDTSAVRPLEGTFTFAATELCQELGKLNIRKAVPRHIAPNAVWRLCAATVSERLGPCFARHFRPRSTESLEGDLQDAHVCWLAKPSKPPTSMKSLRPIGLMPPCAKSLASVVARNILDHLRPLLDHLPQFAYCEGRGCGDAILRVHDHFAQVAALHQSQTRTRFKMHHKMSELSCHGGVCLSLDLSSAFDSVSRDLLIQSLVEHNIPNDLINVVQQLHRGAKYIFRTSAAKGQITTTNGIKQGCRAAPTLWVSFTLSILEHMVNRKGLAWLQRVITVFADDFCGHWRIESTQDFEQARLDIALLLEVLEIFQLQINLQKTALLVHLKGKAAKRLLQQHTRTKAGEQFLVLLVHGRECLLKIKDSHTYLGTIIAYRGRQDLNVAHRIAAAQSRYQQIRKVLNGKGPLSTKHRLRLWAACIPPCLLYSLEATGCTAHGLQKLKVLTTRHVRAILKSPAHLTRVSTSDIWGRAVLQPPERLLLCRLQHLCQRRHPASNKWGPDLIYNDGVHQQLTDLLTQLQEAIQGMTEPKAGELLSQASFPCEYCGQVFLTAHARTIHHGLQHHAEAPPPDPRVRPTFHAPTHAIAGLPTCRLCNRNFPRWQQLKLHIETGACPGLGGSSHKLSPPAADNSLMSIPHQVGPAAKAQIAASAPPEVSPNPEAEVAKQSQPLVLSASFKQSLGHWESHLNCQTTKTRLKCYCVVCGMWIACSKKIRQHYHKVHQHDYPHVEASALRLCASFKGHFTRGRSCRYCGSTVGAPCRHVTQCVVLWQLCVAVTICRAEASGEDGGRRLDSGHIRSLHAVGTGSTGDGPDSLSAAAKETAPRAELVPGSSGKPASASDALWGVLRPAPPRPRTSATSAPPHAPPGLAVTPSQQTGSQARGTAGGTAPRHAVCPLLPPGRQVNSALSDGSGQGVEGAPSCGGSIDHLIPADSAHQLPPPRTPSQDSKGDCNGIRERISPQGGVARLQRCLDLPTLGIQAAQTGQGRSEGTPCSRRGGSHHHRAAEDGYRGPDPEVPEHGELGKAGGRGGPAGCLSSGNILTWLQRGRGLRAVSQAGRIRPDGAGRVQHESRRLAEATLSTAAGTADLRGRPVGEDSPAHLVSAPPTCSNPWILPFTLRNPNNLCYLNSFVHSAALLERHTRCALLPHSFRDPGARLLDAHHLLKFHLLGWRHPAEQHDVVELIDHLLPRLQPQHARYTWSARQGLGEGIRVHSRAELTRCLPLSNSAIDTPDLQRIISRWHIQDTCNALDSPAPWLFMQLPRGELAAFGLITKNHNPVILPQVVRLPVFSSACSLDLRWHDYRVVACILHHGERLTAGHYNVVSLGGFTPHVLDDAKSAFPATTAFLESASCTAYVLVLTHASQLGEQTAAAAQNQGFAECNDGGDEHVPAAEVRGRVDRCASEPPGVPREGS